MAVKKTIEIDVRVSDGVAKVENVTDKVKILDKTAKETSKSQTMGIKKTSVAMQELDNKTGGLSGSLIDMGNAAKKGGAAMRSAFISSGIGILVVALGFVIAHWEDIKDLIDSSSKKLQNHIDWNRENSELLERELTILEEQEKILQLKGESVKANREEQKKILKSLAEENVLLLENLQTQLKKERSSNREVTAYERLKILASSLLSTAEMSKQIILAGIAESERTKELDKEIHEAKVKQIKIEQELLGIDKKNTDDDKETPEERRNRLKAEKEEALRFAEEQRIRLEKEKRDALDSSGISLTPEQIKAGISAEEELQKGKLEVFKKFTEDRKKLAEGNMNFEIWKEQQLKDAKINLIGQTAGAVALILGRNSKVGKSAGIAQALINTYQGITEVWKTPSLLPEPAATINKIASTITVGASGFAAVRNIASVRLPFTAGGGGGGATPSMPAPPKPSFNLVGNSQANQLAGAINRQDQPIQAFVVSRTMTNQQEMDRNIRSTASVG